MILKCKPLEIEQTIKKAASFGLAVEKIQMTAEIWKDNFDGVVRDRRTGQPLPGHHERELKFSGVPVELAADVGRNALVFASEPQAAPAEAKKSKGKK
jgi:hypothetical protein